MIKTIMKKFVMTLIFTLALSAAAQAANAKWETFTFTDDIDSGMEALKTYCATHDVTVSDVLWANQTSLEKIAAGTTLYLPERHADILTVWQHVSRQQPKTSAADMDFQKFIESLRKGDQAQTPVIPETSKDTTAQAQDTIIVTETPKPAPKPAKPTKKAPKKQQSSPAKVIAQTAKPDKILTAKNKKKAEIPGLMDPIIVLSPNGDATTGPMRLVISGDKVKVVKLPPDALPKKPSVSDVNTPFTATDSGWSYLPHYDMTTKDHINRSYTNLNSLNGKMMWPVDGKISSPFGKWRGKHKHEGIDIPMPAGTPIRAARNGVVARTGNNSTMGFRGYGNFVMLDHGGGIKTFYAHCSSVAVFEGQKIMQGQIIGYVGSTGRSTANHLHFEVRVNNVKVNPVPYMAGNTHLASHK